MSRIEAAHHFVSEDRVDGNLALSRAFGDFQYKSGPRGKPIDWKTTAVTAHPDVKVVNRTAEDEFIINACDGIWDCLTNEQACEQMSAKLEKPVTQYHKPVE